MNSLPLVTSDTPTPRQPLLSLTEAELADWLQAEKFHRWYAASIRQWVLVKRLESFEAMSDLPKKLRSRLEETFTPLGSGISKELVSTDGTRKLLVKLWDGADVECVMIPDAARRTACISTQVGCGMGCVFCASGLNGVQRNLKPGEIVEQLVRLRNRLPEEERLTNIVVMGMGEPLANLDHLLDALETASDPKGLGIGARHITISTVGLPTKIERLANAGKQYHLAVSLHAPNDELRTQIVPTNQKTGIEAILAASDAFREITGRQVTFEYVMLGGVNDRPQEAYQLIDLLRNRDAHVNLIPFNEVHGLPYRRPSEEAINEFIEILKEAHVVVHVRKRKGSDIAAACGQLRRAEQQKRQAAESEATKL